MTEPMMWTMISAVSFAGLVVIAISALKGWREWIGLQRLSIEGRAASKEPSGGVPSSARTGAQARGDCRRRRSLERPAAFANCLSPTQLRRIDAVLTFPRTRPPS
jgi:hypothetical protein